MRSKLSPSEWDDVVQAYLAWDPEQPDAGSVAELSAQHGISKQSLYAELRKRGIQLKRVEGQRPSGGSSSTDDAVRALAELLIQARIRIEQLERLLRANGIPVP